MNVDSSVMHAQENFKEIKKLILNALLEERQADFEYHTIRERLRGLVVFGSVHILPFVNHNRRPSESCSQFP